MREFLAFLPPVDMLLPVLTSMSGRRAGLVEESNDPLWYLASNDGDAVEDIKIR